MESRNWRCLNCSNVISIPLESPDPSICEKCETQSLQPQFYESESKQKSPMMIALIYLFQCSMGLVAACLLFAACQTIVRPFRGAGYITVLGTTAYRGDQTLYNLIAGVSILVAGWTSARFAYRRGYPYFAKPLMIATLGFSLLSIFMK